jgi:hypothetical protein
MCLFAGMQEQFIFIIHLSITYLMYDKITLVCTVRVEQLPESPVSGTLC